MKNKITFLITAVIVLVLAGAGVLGYFSLKYDRTLIPSVDDVWDGVGSIVTIDPSGVSKFSSESDFKEYLAEVRNKTADGYSGSGTILRGNDTVEIDVAWDEVAMMADEAGLAIPEATGMGGATEPDRVSGTNVQVMGIDEPDIVKTDGNEIYYSVEDYYYYWRDEDSSESATYLIDALPVDEIGVDGEIFMNGDLLLSDNVLVVLSYGEIVAYDVSDPAEPVEIWDITFEDASYQTARLYDGKIYLVTSTWIDTYDPCPIVPFTLEGKEVEVACTDVYHPVDPVPAEETYHVMSIDPVAGTIEDQVSFVASYDNTVVYMSGENMYITYANPGSYVDLMIDFFENEAYNLISTSALQQIRNLAVYEISDQAKMVELQVILEEWMASLNDDEELEIQNELANEMDEFMEEKKRDYYRTGIVKIGLDNLSVDEVGEVPGTLLNQWSLDEYEGYLRVATTVGEFGWWGMFSTGVESMNDLYVLDKNLNIKGQVLDLGAGERIYSARFMGDEGYMVTFRETDPFYVFDLSDPKNPEAVGELKIPGYSSYLHPLAEDLILGVGREDWEVKLSLFDVSDPSDPQEIDKYTLDESWSDVLETHHAFLHDPDFGVFFMPGGQGGYIFSYADNELSLEKAVANIEAERALYINDYLYVVGRDEIVVLDENTWERAAELDL